MQDKAKPVAHIIGFIGSGKTTFARRLEQDTGAVRFTKDEWMVRLFGNTPPQDTFADYDQRMALLATDMALKCLEAGLDVIIDEGFWTKDHRQQIRDKVAKVGASPRFYYLDASFVMKARTLRRSKNPPADSYVIDEEAFHYYWQFFQPPDNDEDCEVISHA